MYKIRMATTRGNPYRGMFSVDGIFPVLREAAKPIDSYFPLFDLMVKACRSSDFTWDFKDPHLVHRDPEGAIYLASYEGGAIYPQKEEITRVEAKDWLIYLYTDDRLVSTFKVKRKWKDSEPFFGK